MYSPNVLTRDNCPLGSKKERTAHEEIKRVRVLFAEKRERGENCTRISLVSGNERASAPCMLKSSSDLLPGENSDFGQVKCTSADNYVISFAFASNTVSFVSGISSGTAA